MLDGWKVDQHFRGNSTFLGPNSFLEKKQYGKNSPISQEATSSPHFKLILSDGSGNLRGGRNTVKKYDARVLGLDHRTPQLINNVPDQKKCPIKKTLVEQEGPFMQNAPRLGCVFVPVADRKKGKTDIPLRVYQLIPYFKMTCRKILAQIPNPNASIWFL